MSMRAARSLWFGLIVLVLLSACAGKTPTLAPVASATPRSTSTPAPTVTPFPTETPAATATLAPTATLPPTATASPTPDANLGGAKLIGLTWMKDYNMLISFQFPQAVDVKQYTVTVEDKDYQCQMLAKYPDRLYCTGPGVKVLNYAWIRVYPTGSSTPGFEKKIWIPYFDNDYNNQFNGPY